MGSHCSSNLQFYLLIPSIAPTPTPFKMMFAQAIYIVAYAAALATAATTPHPPLSGEELFKRDACNARCGDSTLGATCALGASCCIRRCQSACGQRTGRCEGFLGTTCVCYG
ncbi:hypothetical protein B0T18DRAFT_409391 [Schizothecium vesticola]|uniref:Uncharacterized protein n=1 Tax=Schizothecium vesticola TaxID=314040 RepID=A0AA40F3Q6_9PEZI|nr:hypothetical protein B0T18DRAFT_409391 [Schizothecium vesticola]